MTPKPYYQDERSGITIYTVVECDAWTPTSEHADTEPVRGVNLCRNSIRDRSLGMCRRQSTSTSARDGAKTITHGRGAR